MYVFSLSSSVCSHIVGLHLSIVSYVHLSIVSYSKFVHMHTRERGVEDLILRYVRTKWMAPSKCCGIFFLCYDTTKYTKASLPGRKMSLFSSIIITIILSYAILRIYIILHIYMQVSETEGLAELHWVIGESILEKINSIYFHGISLAFSRMFF